MSATKEIFSRQNEKLALMFKMANPSMDDNEQKAIAAFVYRATLLFFHSSSTSQDFSDQRKELYQYMLSLPGDNTKIERFQNILKQKRKEVVNLNELDEAALIAVREAYGKEEEGPKINSCQFEGCTATMKFMRCSRCKTALYCSIDHQRRDWHRHKLKCISPQ